MNNQLIIDNVAIQQGQTFILRDVSLSLQSGEIGCLLGPSGCGKTSLLRAIAGFHPIAAGSISLHGQTVASADDFIPPEQRKVGMVFQDYALFPHLTIADNIGFGLHKMPASERQARINQLLDLIGMAALGKRYPHQLSGGQQQRVALARSMAPRPQILLLDEPFSNMDTELREQIASEVRELLKADGMTGIVVTHDQLEAFAIADQIAVLGEGQIQQVGSGYELYHKPQTRFVADFIGKSSFIDGTVVDGGKVETALGTLLTNNPQYFSPGQKVQVVLRPDDVLHDEASKLRLPIMHKAFRGKEFLYTLTLPDSQKLLSLSHAAHDYAIGSELPIRIQEREHTLFTLE